jgi:hypothetical protein
MAGLAPAGGDWFQYAGRTPAVGPVDGTVTVGTRAAADAVAGGGIRGLLIRRVGGIAAAVAATAVGST